MNSSEDELGASLRALGVAMEETLTEHPEAEEWLAFTRGALAEERTERLRDHLSVCPECTRLALALPALVAADAPAASKAEVAAGWKDLQARMRAEARASEPAKPAARTVFESPSPSRQEPSRQSLPNVPTHPSSKPWMRWALPIAASLVIGVGLGWWMHTPPGTLTLESAGATLRTGVDQPDAPGSQRAEDAPELVVSFADGRLISVAVLTPAVPVKGETLSARILDATGRERWREHGVSSSPQGVVFLTLLRGFLPDGTYRLEIDRQVGETRERVLTQNVRVVGSSP